MFSVWRVVGGDSTSFIHTEVFSGVQGGLSLCLCVLGGDCDLWGDLKYFDPTFLDQKVYHFWFGE